LRKVNVQLELHDKAVAHQYVPKNELKAIIKTIDVYLMESNPIENQQEIINE